MTAQDSNTDSLSQESIALAIVLLHAVLILHTLINTCYIGYILHIVYTICVLIINNSICLCHISSNKTIQRRITLYMNIQITLK